VLPVPSLPVAAAVHELLVGPVRDLVPVQQELPQGLFLEVVQTWQGEVEDARRHRDHLGRQAAGRSERKGNLPRQRGREEERRVALLLDLQPAEDRRGLHPLDRGRAERSPRGLRRRVLLPRDGRPRGVRADGREPGIQRAELGQGPSVLGQVPLRRRGEVERGRDLPGVGETGNLRESHVPRPRDLPALHDPLVAEVDGSDRHEEHWKRHRGARERPPGQRQDRPGERGGLAGRLLNELGQPRARLLDGAALLRPLREQGAEQALQIRGEIPPMCLDWGRRVVEYRACRVRPEALLERMDAGQHLVEHDAEGEEIGLRGEDVPQDLLG
jgi:hypothetical protein